MNFSMQMQRLNAAQGLMIQAKGISDDVRLSKALERLAAKFTWEACGIGEDALAALPSARRGDYPTVRLEADND